MQGFGTMIFSFVATYGARVLGVLALLVAAWFLSSWVRSALTKGLARANFDPTLSKFFAATARWAILIFAILGCLGVFGVQTTSFAAVIAAAGLAVGTAGCIPHCQYRGDDGTLGAGA